MRGKGLLAVDCSLRLTGVALVEPLTGAPMEGGGRVVASECLDLGRRQAAELPLMAGRLVEGAGWSWTDVGLVAVTSGPGYFTGIRVGAAWASALAYGLEAKVIPVPSLEMLAASSPRYGADGGVLAIVYAGRSSVYAASFGCCGALEPGEYGGEALAGWLASHEGAAVVSDDPQRAAGAVGPNALSRVPIAGVRPDVSRLASLAWERRGAAIHPFELRVTYCRAPQTGRSG